MSTEQDHQTGGTSARLTRSRLSRGRLAVGTVGLAAVLGASAYVVTRQVIDDPARTVAQEVRPIAPITTRPITPSVSSSGSPTDIPTAEISGSSLPAKTIEEIKEARRKMAKDGVPVKPPVIPKVTKTVENVAIEQEGSLKSGGIVRVMAANEDLTGQRELAYVAGGIKEYRNVSCSQIFQFSTNPKPAKKDNLLMCWRTTPTKSVVAMVVDPEGKPSKDKAVDAIEKKWRSMD